MTKNSKPSRKWLRQLDKMWSKVTGSHITTFIIICLIGSLSLSLSHLFSGDEFWAHFFRDIGIALFPIGIMSLIYEYVLRDNFLENMSSTIRDLMPSRYSNLREAGIVDVYPELRIDKLANDIKRVEWCEIRILDIWMENFQRIEKAIYNAIVHRHCDVKILLWHPQEINALEKRAMALENMSVSTTVTHIIDNLELFTGIMKKLQHDNTPGKGKFEVRLYKCFIGVSLIGFGSEMLVGNYLRNRVSSMGTQIKVSGEQHFLYRELNDHFFAEWDDEKNTIEFTEELFSELLMWNNNRNKTVN